MSFKTRLIVFFSAVLICAGTLVLTVSADTKVTKETVTPATESSPSQKKIRLIEIDAPITRPNVDLAVVVSF